MNKTRIAVLTALMTTLLPLSVNAELIPVDDSELSTYSGQAIIAVDEYSVSSNDFLRVTLGATIETNATVDKLELGKFDRAGNSAAADIDIDNLRLGHIDPVTKEYVPFVIENPYIEFAFSEDAGTRDVIGLRMGAGSASGTLTADINTLTGNFEVMIDHDNNSATDPVPAQLLDSAGAAVDVRGTHLGAPGGDCATNNGCISLNNLASININDSAASGDMFLSYQNIDIDWAKTLNDGSIDVTSLIETTQGAFINFPTGIANVPLGDLDRTVSGSVESTRYTDAALGLFP